MIANQISTHLISIEQNEGKSSKCTRKSCATNMETKFAVNNKLHDDSSYVLAKNLRNPMIWSKSTETAASPVNGTTSATNKLDDATIITNNNNNNLKVIDSDNDDDDDNEDDDDDDEDESSSDESCSTSASMNFCVNEIPVWVRNEQRWVSGITEQTTCNDIINALLAEDGNNNSTAATIITPATTTTTTGTAAAATAVSTSAAMEMNTKKFVITERWRRVEQVLDGRTKILKIWTAWGETQPEVRFTLRPNNSHNSGDRDSGRGSPTGSLNSAIVRRRRHRVSKTSFAWLTHGQTIHPKSQKPNIERLMKLILEQGEVIQHQLAKLRDRELQITDIEEERHRLREKEHGKNYLLEAYLNGLHEADDKEITTGNSDSGVHTEETTTSPEIGATSSGHMDENSDTYPTTSRKKSRSKREAELLIEHESIRDSISNKEKDPEIVPSATNNDDELSTQIELLERLVVLNKHLQKEEELLVRLGAKIKRYEADASGLTEQQVKEAIEKVDTQLNQGTSELQHMECQIKYSDEMLQDKSNALKNLYDELEEAEIEHGRLSQEKLLQEAVSRDIAVIPDANVNQCREYLADNVYNVSKSILKTKSCYDTLQNREISDYIRHTPEHMLLNPNISVGPSYYHNTNPGTSSALPISIHHIPVLQPPLQFSQQQTQAQIHYSPDLTSRISNTKNANTITSVDLLSSMNYLDKYNQRNNINNNNVMQATNIKLGPKKISLQEMLFAGGGDSNSSDTGLSSLSCEDSITNLGTLV